MSVTCNKIRVRVRVRTPWVVFPFSFLQRANVISEDIIVSKVIDVSP